MGERPERRGPHESRICRFSPRGTNRPHDGVVDVRLFHDSWMVVLRGESGGIPPWAKSNYSLPLDLGWCSDDRLDPFSPDCLVACRCYKRPHGNPEPCFTHCAERRDRCRNTSLSMEQQLRCGGTRVTSVSHY